MTLLLGINASAQEREPEYKVQRTGKLGLYLKGGTSWTTGGGVAKFDQYTPTQMYGGAGMTWNFNPWFRLGLNYDYTMIDRNYINPALSSTTMENISQGLFIDQLHRTRLHGADITADFNIMELFNKRSDKGWFNLYLGTGFGWMLGKQNISTRGFSNSIVFDNSKVANTLYPNAEMSNSYYQKTERNRIEGPYIPVRLSTEFHVLPQLAIGLEGGYKYSLGKLGLEHRNMFTAAVSLRFLFTGKIKCRACEAKEADFEALMEDFAYLQEECRKAKAEKDAEIERLKEENAALVAKTNVPVKATITEHTVFFDQGKSEMTDVEVERLREFVKQLDSNATISIVGEASNEGGDAFNQKLSDMRVAAVVHMLRELGIGLDKISSAKGIGSSAKGEGPLFRRVRINMD